MAEKVAALGGTLDGMSAELRNCVIAYEPEQDCFLCAGENIQPPARGRMATGSRLDYGDTYSDGPHCGEYKRIVFSGHLCEMHANGDDIISFRYSA